MISFSVINVNSGAKMMMMEALNNNNIGQTEVIKEFERKFAEFMGVKYAIAVANGTMADTIALAVLKHKYPNKKKVIVPALTFIAQINSIYYNHLEPVFYDYKGEFEIDDDTLCFFPVHLLGKPTRIPNLDIPVIEDACEALGSKLDGEYCGTMGDMGTFSFFPSHVLSTGEGGMIVTDNEEYSDLAKRLRNHGKIKGDEFHFDIIGFNGKMNAMEAIIGLSLVNELPFLFKKRNKNFIYLGGKEEPGEYVVPHGFPAFYENRDEKMKELKERGIDCRNLFSSIPTQEVAYKHLGYKLGDFPKSEIIGSRGLYVPCHQGINRRELEYIRVNL